MKKLNTLPSSSSTYPLGSYLEFWVGYNDIRVEGFPVCDSTTGKCESEYTAWASAYDASKPAQWVNAQCSVSAATTKTACESVKGTWTIGRCTENGGYVADGYAATFKQKSTCEASTHDNHETKDCVSVRASRNVDGNKASSEQWLFSDWRFDSCAQKKYPLCEMTNACPEMSFPCYYQPDNILDWCEPLKLTDVVCENLGRDSHVPPMALGYLYYLHQTFTAPTPPATLMLTLASPCDVSGARTFPVKMYSSDLLLIEGYGSKFGIDSDWAEGATPIGFNTPLSLKRKIDWSVESTNGGHAMCAAPVHTPACPPGTESLLPLSRRYQHARRGRRRVPGPDDDRGHLLLWHGRLQQGFAPQEDGDKSINRLGQ